MGEVKPGSWSLEPWDAIVVSVVRASMLLVILSCCLQAPEAVAERATRTMDEARVMLRRQEYGRARRALQQLLESGELRPDGLVEIYSNLARCSAALRRPQEARDAYVRLLAIDPAFYVASHESPLIREPFEQAQAFWQDRQTPSLRFETPQQISRAEPFTVDAVITQGEGPALLERITLHVRQSVGSFHDIETVDGRAEIPPELFSRGGDSLELFLTAHDEWGNTVVSLGSADEPLRIPLGEEASSAERPPPQRAWYQQWWFWTIVGAAVVGLAVGIPVGLTTSDSGGGCEDALGAACDFELHPEL